MSNNPDRAPRSRPLGLTEQELQADAAHSEVESVLIARQRVLLQSHETLAQQMAELTMGQQAMSERVTGLETTVAKIESNFGKLGTELRSNSAMTASISEDTRGIVEAMKTIQGGVRFFAWIGEKRLAILGGAALIIGGWEVVTSWLNKP